MNRGFVGELLSAYRGFGTSMQRQLVFAPREATITAYLVLGCFAIFLGFLPRIFATDLSNAPDQSLAAGVIMWFFVVMFFLPLVFYGLSALGHLIARRFGGQGSFYGARLTMGWVLVVSTPLILIKSIIGSALLYRAPSFLPFLNLLLILAIIAIWSICISTTEGFSKPFRVFTTALLILALPILAIYFAGQIANTAN